MSSCTSLYEAPKSNEVASMVQAKNSRSGLATWTVVQILKVDNKTVGIFNSSAKIHPGNHTLTIKTQFNEGILSGGPFEAINDINATFKPQMTYYVQSKAQGSSLLTWITDSKGNRVSPVVSSSYHTKPMDHVILVPSGR